MKFRLPLSKHRRVAPARAWRHRSLKHSTRVWWRWLWRFVLAGAVLMITVFLITLTWVSRDLPTPEGIVRRTVSQSTKIYDRTGKIVLYEIHGEERRTSVELKDIPNYLKQATLTAEDRNFYQHHGFSLTAMVRALLVNFLKGTKAQGASTITQQFIKNAILSNEKSYVRKIKELFLAYQIERRFTKDEILRFYLNEIPYGSNAYGAEAAAQIFFRKSVKDISLPEAAILAALPKAPPYYSPWGNHLEDLLARQHYILDGMAEQGYITKDEATAAKKEKLNFQPRRESIIAPHFVFYVKEQLANLYGDRMVEQGGLKIITSLDVAKQQLAEKAVEENLNLIKRYRGSNAALVAIEVATGQILALVGSVDYFNNDIQGQVNVALRPRQPGSSFKPVVYATALSQGFTPETLVYDVATNFKTDTEPYSPKDYDGKERGPIDLRHALAGSLNIPAVKLLYLTGINNVLNTADALGYTTLKDRSRFGLSLVLGGAEVKLLEHTAAFATLARDGLTKPTVSILKIEDSQGNVLQEFHNSAGKKVLEVEPVRELTSILSDNAARSYIFGANNRLVLEDRPVAAKTGTTNDYHDAWTVGYTPDLAVGVWVGNNDNQAMSKGADGSVVAAPIWQKFFSEAVKNLPVQSFVSPLPRTVDKPMLNGDLGGTVVTIDKSTGLLATALTPESQKQEKLFRQYHSILHYVTPSDPLGPIPANPAADPNYQLWEDGVRVWVEKQGLKDEMPPTTFDYTHTEANQPRLIIISPSSNQTINNNWYRFSVNAQAARGIKKVDYFINNNLVATSSLPPFDAGIQLGELLSSGYYTLRVVAVDDVDNQAEVSLNFNFLNNQSPLSESSHILYPANNQIIKLTDFPLNVKISNNYPEKLKQVDFYLTSVGSSSRWLGVIKSPAKNNTLTWPGQDQPGNYILSLTLTTVNNNTIPGSQINLIINQ